MCQNYRTPSDKVVKRVFELDVKVVNFGIAWKWKISIWSLDLSIKLGNASKLTDMPVLMYLSMYLSN